MKGTPGVPFYKTPTFFICVAAIVVFLILFVVVMPKANAQRGEPKRGPLVELALKKDKEDKVREALKWDFAFIPIYAFGLSVLCFFVARVTNAHLHFTWLVISLVFIGAFVDVCENITLLHVMETFQKSIWTSTARILEILKLVGPVIGTVYWVGLAIWGGVNALRR